MEQHPTLIAQAPARRRAPAQVQQRCESVALPWWKRALDLSFLLFCLPGLLLVGAVVALIVRLGSPGPILFRQKPVGYKGHHFFCYNFRTIALNPEPESHRPHAPHLL